MIEPMANGKDLRAQALELPRDERASLAHDLLESLDEPLEDPADMEAAWLAEVQRRMREIADGSADLVDWDEVRAEALARLRRS
jgi:putative addiction module component (TIGR02574 family)